MNTENKKTVYITRNELFKDLPLLMCNNIKKADESFIDDNMEIYQKECELCATTGTKDGSRCEECYGEGYHNLEVYQSFLCDPNDWQIEQLKEYGIILGYSELLDLYVLPIYDFGTVWSAFSYSKQVPEDYQLGYNETLTRSTPY